MRLVSEVRRVLRIELTLRVDLGLIEDVVRSDVDGTAREGVLKGSSERDVAGSGLGSAAEAARRKNSAIDAVIETSD